MTVVVFFGGEHAQKLKCGDSRSISVFKQCQSNALDDWFFWGGEHAQKPNSTEKKNSRGTLLGSVSRVFH